MNRKFKKGAASFYIVAFATLILVILAASFAVVIISAITRMSNDDLSQSAYDAALAGIEDAKLAYSNYKACMGKESTYIDALTGGSEVKCQDIVYFMNHPNCDMVAHILGRIGKNEEGREVPVQESNVVDGSTSNNMNEAYTCVMIQTNLSDYRASLSSSNLYQVVKVDLADGVRAQDIDSVRISWYSNRDGVIHNYTNVARVGSDPRVVFPSLKTTKAATPPTLSVGLIQTANEFTMEQINSRTIDGRTDRATVYLVPTGDAELAQSWDLNNFTGVYRKGQNSLSAEEVANTNNHAKNLPFVVYCPENSSDEFACSATMKLPQPIAGVRSNETFMFVVSLPYGQPDTDFSLEFFCADGKVCSTGTSTSGSTSGSSTANIDGVQVVIDSTGRANDLYRRVEMRLESTDSTFAYPMYAIQVLGNNSGTTAPLEKNMTVTDEHNFK